MSNIFHFIKAGGWIMYPLLALSLLAGVVIVERLLAFRQLGDNAPGLLPATLELCRTQQYDQALKACRARSGPVAACLATILENRQRPLSFIERRVEETGQKFFARLERMLPILDTTTTISPLLGLLGTIIGMISAFNAISSQAGKGNNDAVLNGVAEALYATATGIVIAVVCFVAFNYFDARLRSISSDTEIASTELLNALAEAELDRADNANLNGFGGESLNGEGGQRAIQTASRT